jgi:two-component system sensor histidine kinase QseC
MKRKGQPLASRVARLQTWVIAATLLAVTLATAAAVSVLLVRKTDQQLETVLARVAYYVRDKPQLDVPWLEGEIEEVRPLDARVELLDASGALRFSQGDGAQFSAAPLGCSTQGDLRVCAAEARGLRVAVGKSREGDALMLRGVVGILALLSLAATLVVAILSRGVTARSIAPLSQLTTRVARLEPGSGERLALSSGLAEVDVLAERFDALVARFEEALEREKRFTAEASHELRTPLTLALAEMEALARGEGDGAEPARALGALNRLARLAESLLWFARAQGKIVDARTDVVNISDIVRAQVDALTKTHPGRRFRLDLPDEALVQAEEPLIARALGNLFDNAIKYGDGSEIAIEIVRTADNVRVTVVNGGAGIPEAARSRVFVPFFRLNDANPQAEGFGLGLPFARAVARAHGGDLRLGTLQAIKTELVLELPLIGWSDTAALEH